MREAGFEPAEWLKNPNDERALVDEGCFPSNDYKRYVEFAERFLVVPKGRVAGEPLRLVIWQIDDIFRPVFGWKRPDGTRRFRKVSVWVPKKNGKTVVIAVVVLTV